MSVKSRVGIIGAGPGGLMAAFLLASRGHQVTVFERSNRVGGRCAKLEKGSYSWDLGPTFLIYKEILEDCFKQVGINVNQYLNIQSLDPMYRLYFSDKELEVFYHKKKLYQELEKKFPGAAKEFQEFMNHERTRFKALRPCLETDFSSLKRYFSWDLIKALPHLGFGKTVMQRLRSFFSSDDRALSFAFQAKYLGMSAWECPSMFSILPYLEHEYGVHHVEGGLYRINEVLANLAKKMGVKIYLGSPVREVLVREGKAYGLRLEGGIEEKFDHMILNADFAYSMKNLLNQKYLRKYRQDKIERMKYSCSTFMVYLGLKRSYNLPFHAISFADDYGKNVKEVFNEGTLSKDFSFYVRTPNQIDPSCAPYGHTAMYILVPVPNLKISSISWQRQKHDFRNKVIHSVEKRLGVSLLDAICEEHIITPEDWHHQHHVHHGATFNLAHNWPQLAMFRPGNAFSDVQNIYLVGGGTHPGSGLPTIFESSRIATKLIEEKYGREFASEESHTQTLEPLAISGS